MKKVLLALFEFSRNFVGLVCYAIIGVVLGAFPIWMAYFSALSNADAPDRWSVMTPAALMAVFTLPIGLIGGLIVGIGIIRERNDPCTKATREENLQD